MTTTRIYLVRHGQTVWNVEHRFQGHLDVPLSDVGRKQAEALALRIGAEPANFSSLYSSDLLRAVETAQPISRALSLKIKLLPDLREINGGRWQGSSLDEIERDYPGQMA
ncbi:MAG: histidine phosphatase family protein, partial [Chloroflexota bacterium]|nr:histidine phosphatase family protein [Chloroflexota bacterium]